MKRLITAAAIAGALAIAGCGASKPAAPTCKQFKAYVNSAENANWAESLREAKQETVSLPGPAASASTLHGLAVPLCRIGEITMQQHIDHDPRWVKLQVLATPSVRASAA